MSIPTFDPKDTMKSFEFINFPTIHSSSVTPLRWNINPAIYAEHVTLYPNTISHLSIELHQVNQLCQEYNSLLICEKQLIHEPSCLSDLFHNISTRCELVESVNQKSIQLTRSHKLLIFFLEETEILIYCGDAVEKMNLRGLYEIVNVNDCKISSATFSYHVNGREPHMYIEEPSSIIVSDNVTLEHLDKYLQRNESAAQEPQVLSHLLKAWQQQKNDTNIDNNPFILPELALPSLIISCLMFLMFLATGMWFCIKAYKIMQWQHPGDLHQVLVIHFCKTEESERPLKSPINTHGKRCIFPLKKTPDDHICKSLTNENTSIIAGQRNSISPEKKFCTGKSSE